MEVLQAGRLGLGQLKHQVLDGSELIVESPGGLGGSQRGFVTFKADEKRFRDSGFGILEGFADLRVGGQHARREFLGTDVGDFLGTERREGGLEGFHRLAITIKSLALGVAVGGGRIERESFETGDVSGGGGEFLLGLRVAAGALGAGENQQDGTREGSSPEGDDELVILNPTHISEGKLLTKIT